METAELSEDLKQVYDFAYAAAYAEAMDQVAFDEDQDAALDWAYDYAIFQANAAVDRERSRLAAINLGD